MKCVAFLKCNSSFIKQRMKQNQTTVMLAHSEQSQDESPLEQLPDKLIANDSMLLVFFLTKNPIKDLKK